MSELPEGVRRRVVEVAADRLAALPADEVPASLRPFAKFAPGRRRQVLLPIATALETDDGFREAVAAGVRDGLPELVSALEAGEAVPAGDPDDVAAVAYLVRSEGWEALVARAAEREAQRREDEAGRRAAGSDQVARRDMDAQLRTLGRRLEAAEQARDQATTAAERERARAREAAERARSAEKELTALTARHGTEQAELRAAREQAERRLRELESRLADTQASVERLRRDSRDSREAADMRRWLLLDTLARAVAGLREELAPSLPTRRPADLVDAAPPSASPTPSPDDPASVDLLLGLPQAHLIVDGYNVTKTGYPDLTLEDQRGRLVTGLAALAARTGAEVTCVFDGADVGVVPAAASRRVRVRFSRPGQIADEVIRALVRAEPAGRPVTVCSADNEVIDGVRRDGARILAPSALLTRLARA